MSAQVVSIPPKVETSTYKRIPYKITFVPATKQWRWEYKYQPPALVFDGWASSLTEAHKQARRSIDGLVAR